MCVSVCVRVCLCYSKKSQFQNRIWTVAVHTSELETISLPVDGRCIGTKFLLGASETGILCFGAAHQFHTRFMQRGPERVQKMERKNLFPLLPQKRKASGSGQIHAKHIAIAKNQKCQRHLGENAQSSKPERKQSCEMTPITARRHTFDSDRFSIHFRVNTQEQQDCAAERMPLFEEPRQNNSMEKRRFTLCTGAEQIWPWCLH